MRFLPWSLPRVGNGGGKGQLVTPGHQLDDGSNAGKRVRLTRKTRPGVSSHSIPDPGHPTLRRWKRLRLLPLKEREVRWACLAIFFLDLELGEVFALWDAWNLPSEGSGVAGSQLDSPAEGNQCTGTDPFFNYCTVRTTTTTTTPPSLPSPPFPSPPPSSPHTPTTTTRHVHLSVTVFRVASPARAWWRCSVAQGPPAEALHHSCGVELSGLNDARPPVRVDGGRAS